MPNKQTASKSTQRSARVSHRGHQPGDKIVNRTKTSKPVQRIGRGNDLLTAITRPQRPATAAKPTMPFREKQRIVAEAIGTPLIRVANMQDWDQSERAAALAYLKSLVYGNGSPEQLAGLTTSRVRKAVQKHFALTMWFKRRMIGTTTFAGMNQPWFAKRLEEAKQKYPASSIPA